MMTFDERWVVDVISKILSVAHFERSNPHGVLSKEKRWIAVQNDRDEHVVSFLHEVMERIIPGAVHEFQHLVTAVVEDCVQHFLKLGETVILAVITEATMQP